MMKLSKRKIIFLLILVGFLYFILYRLSFIPKDINLSYDGIMYSNEAYQAKDYNNLDIKNTKVHMKGKLYKAWFKRPYFFGYIETDIAPVDDTVLRPAIVTAFDSVPSPISYDYYNRKNRRIEEYATTFIYKDLSGIYLDFKEFSGYEGYSVVAPAKNIEDIDDVWNDILDIITDDTYVKP